MNNSKSSFLETILDKIFNKLNTGDIGNEQYSDINGDTIKICNGSKVNENEADNHKNGEYEENENE